MLLAEPPSAGTKVHDAQGDCEVTSRGPCPDRRDLPDCAMWSAVRQADGHLGDLDYARAVDGAAEIASLQFLPRCVARARCCCRCDRREGWTHGLLSPASTSAALRRRDVYGR